MQHVEPVIFVKFTKVDHRQQDAWDSEKWTEETTTGELFKTLMKGHEGLELESEAGFSKPPHELADSSRIPESAKSLYVRLPTVHISNHVGVAFFVGSQRLDTKAIQTVAGKIDTYAKNGRSDDYFDYEPEEVACLR